MSKGRIRSFVIFLAVIISFIGFLFRVVLKNNEKEVLTDSWDITVNGKLVYIGNPSNYKFETLAKGDVVTLNTTDEVIVTPKQALIISEQFSAVRILFNGEEVWEFGSDYPKESMVPSAFLEAVLTGDTSKDADVNGAAADGAHQGIITVEFTASVNDAFTNIQNFSLVKQGTLTTQLIRSAPQTLVISCFLCLLGLFLILLGIFMGWKGGKILSLLGVCSLSSGIWCLGSTKLLQLFSDNFLFNTYADSYSLYVFIGMFLLLQCVIAKKCTNKKLVWVGTAIYFLYAVIAILLTSLNVVPLYFPLQGIGILEIINEILFFIVYLNDHFRCKSDQVRNQQDKGVQSNEKILLFALLVHFAYGILDTLRFNIKTYLLPEGANVGYTYSQYGLLITIFLLFFALMLDATNAAQFRTEQEVWQRLALSDPLTKLGNRVYAQQLFQELRRKYVESNEASGYAMLIFD